MTKRAWQRMLSGRRLNVLEPSPLDIEIEDIAHGLCRVARWNGQTRGQYPYSVAQHSILVEQIMRDMYPQLEYEFLLMGLLHDASEYVIGDMISPVKGYIAGEYKNLEEKLDEAIHLRFSLPIKTPTNIKKIIKQADIHCAYLEATHLAGFSDEEALKHIGSPPKNHTKYCVAPLPTQQVCEKFIFRFNLLQNRINSKHKT